MCVCMYICMYLLKTYYMYMKGAKWAIEKLLNN